MFEEFLRTPRFYVPTTCRGLNPSSKTGHKRHLYVSFHSLNLPFKWPHTFAKSTESRTVKLELKLLSVSHLKHVRGVTSYLSPELAFGLFKHSKYHKLTTDF